MLGFLKAGRRRTLRETPLTPEQWRTLEEAVPMVRRLPEAARPRLSGLVQIFLDEKVFEGGAGFAVTDDMKLIIAAEACLLLVFRDDEVPYPELVNVIVYAEPWRAARREALPGGVMVEFDGANLGESWSFDTVILAWRQVAADAKADRDGRNVALHEFAHQLDAQDGVVDGAPALPSRARYREWARVFQREFAALQEARESVIDDYGAHSPPEFFAVLTEQFYEQPEVLAAHHPALFAQLCAFYRCDPRTFTRVE